MLLRLKTLITEAVADAKESVPAEINKKLAYTNEMDKTTKEATAQWKVESAFKEAKETVPGMITEKLSYKETDSAETKEKTAQWQLKKAFDTAKQTVVDLKLNER